MQILVGKLLLSAFMGIIIMDGIIILLLMKGVH